MPDRKLLFFLLCTFSVFGPLQAQQGWNLGYGAGKWTQGLPNLDGYAYHFHHSGNYGEVTNKLHILPYYHGLHAGYFLTFGNGGGFEVTWANKHFKYSGKSELLDIRYKVRFNTIGFGLFQNLGKRVRLGALVEAGLFNVFQKMDDKSPANEDITKWTRLGDKEINSSGGTTFYAVFTTRDNGGVGIRPYYSIQWSEVDVTLGGETYYLTNWGITLIFQKGGYQW